ncbi:uncharacterized protein LAJ45_09572 [Morchella importuna]|uniref:uncharacterized protein n=1 Tax=Morchella importuna TaxID=1174673 RepID=UPI001E8D6E9A|nr:uncharacterized protein LAJ45_09572 [Morchella importuna]KAH8146379.1 hypothetical protein LAJ45_09572 [Morchella importuna]
MPVHSELGGVGAFPNCGVGVCVHDGRCSGNQTAWVDRIEICSSSRPQVDREGKELKRRLAGLAVISIYTRW